MTYPYPATAVLAGNGIGTATLSAATIGGFGLDFGLSFGGPTVMGPVTATVTPVAASTAALAEVYALADLQLV